MLEESKLVISIHCLAFIMAVPTATSLKDIYPEDAVAHQQKRWEHLLASFKEKYGKPADFVSRSPGRVNIIGEVSQPSAAATDKPDQRRRDANEAQI